MKALRATLLAGALGLLLVAGPARAADAPTWQTARNVLLPSGATGIPQGFLPAISCPSAGNCVVGDAYSDAGGLTQGLLIEEKAHVWRAPLRLVAPADAANNPGVMISSVSCASAGNCAAVGSYQDANGDAQSYVANEVRGVWSSARSVAMPSNQVKTGQNSTIHSVSCPSNGNCSAVGTYLARTTVVPRVLGFAINEVAGTWRAATPTRLPATANFNPYTTLNQVSCRSAGNCSAVGSFIDAANDTRALVFSEVRGSWSGATTIALPGNANAYPGASLLEVTCVGSTDCTALGSYTNVQGAIEGFSVSETRGRWSRAVAMRMPAGAATNPHVFFYGYGGLSCPSVGNCSAGGQYRDGSNLYQGFLINEVDGEWGDASELSLPAGSPSAGHNGGVVAVSCRSAGNCSAGAAYLDGSGSYQALTVSEVANVWQNADKIVLPPGATSVGVDGGVYGLVCQHDGSCAGSGSYLASATTYQGFTITTN